jgi:hypothetical protein
MPFLCIYIIKQFLYEGNNVFPSHWDLVIEGMKKDEVACIIIEHLKYDENKLKILDFCEY